MSGLSPADPLMTRAGGSPGGGTDAGDRGAALSGAGDPTELRSPSLTHRLPPPHRTQPPTIALTPPPHTAHHHCCLNALHRPSLSALAHLQLRLVPSYDLTTTTTSLTRCHSVITSASSPPLPSFSLLPLNPRYVITCALFSSRVCPSCPSHPLPSHCRRPPPPSPLTTSRFSLSSPPFLPFARVCFLFHPPIPPSPPSPPHWRD